MNARRNRRTEDVGDEEADAATIGSADELDQLEKEVEAETVAEMDAEVTAERKTTDGDKPETGTELVKVPDREQFEPDGPLLSNAGVYRDRWDTIQIGFVDEPMYAVESAGRLLAEVLGDLASTFATKRKDLEAQWRHGGDTSTEELRVAFQAYRSFFNRLVST